MFLRRNGRQLDRFMPEEPFIFNVVEMPKKATTGHPKADAYIDREVKAAVEAIAPILIERITAAVKDMITCGVNKKTPGA
jgi:hypothetical protein